MNLKTLPSEGKIAYLIKPILKVLQEAGGQLERSEIKERIADTAKLPVSSPSPCRAEAHRRPAGRTPAVV